MGKRQTNFRNKNITIHTFGLDSQHNRTRLCIGSTEEGKAGIIYVDSRSSDSRRNAPAVNLHHGNAYIWFMNV